MTAFSTFLPSLTSAISFIYKKRVSGYIQSQFGRTVAALLRGYIYLGQDHGGDLLGGEGLGLTQVLDLDHGVGALLNDLEGPRLDILLDDGVIERSTDKTPRERRVSASDI